MFLVALKKHAWKRNAKLENTICIFDNKNENFLKLNCPKEAIV